MCVCRLFVFVARKLMGVIDGRFWLLAIDRTVDRGSSFGGVCRQVVSSKLLNFIFPRLGHFVDLLPRHYHREEDVRRLPCWGRLHQVARLLHPRHRLLRQWICSWSRRRAGVVRLFRRRDRADIARANCPRRRLGVACRAFLPAVFREDRQVVVRVGGLDTFRGVETQSHPVIACGGAGRNPWAWETWEAHHSHTEEDRAHIRDGQLEPWLRPSWPPPWRRGPFLSAAGDAADRPRFFVSLHSKHCPKTVFRSWSSSFRAWPGFDRFLPSFPELVPSIDRSFSFCGFHTGQKFASLHRFDPSLAFVR
mmetsp:Transcript_15655/g.32388  ORF Transcript_15655/g.32388 Transcript_15655/m.32388 type:complete len:307 (-) Transcript_15655:900-1820(-)